MTPEGEKLIHRAISDSYSLYKEEEKEDEQNVLTKLTYNLVDDDSLLQLT